MSKMFQKDQGQWVWTDTGELFCRLDSIIFGFYFPIYECKSEMLTPGQK